MGDYKYIPMSVAEKIVKRQMAEIPNNSSHINAAIHAANTNMPRKVKAQRRHVVGVLSKFFPYGSCNLDGKEFHIHPWVLQEDNRFHLMQFRLGKHGLFVERTSVNIGKHALARIIFRRQLSTLDEAFEELSTLPNEILVIAGQVSPKRPETIVHSPNGAFILKFYAPGDVGLTTWIDSGKLYEIQTETNDHPVSIAMEFLKGADRERISSVVVDFLAADDGRWSLAFSEYFDIPIDEVTAERVTEVMCSKL